MGFSSLSDLISELTASTPKRHMRPILKIRPNTAGVAATWESLWAMAGDPQAGDLTGTALNAIQCNDSTVGAVYHGGNVSADTKHLTKLGFMTIGTAVAPGYVILYDRLLYYPQINASVNTNQALVNGVGLPRYTDGKGVRMWIEVTTAFGVTTGVLTYGSSGYTNTADVTGRQHGVTVNTTASSAVNRLPHSGSTQNNNYNPFLPLQAGDLGVKSVQSIQFTTAHASGVCALVLGYPLASIPIADASSYAEREFCFQLPSFPRVYDGACLGLLMVGSGALNANTPFSADIEVAWG